MEPVKSNFTSPDLSKALYEELGAAVKGGVYPRNDANFIEYSRMFNGNVETVAKVVVCPLDAEDVSRIILFCTKHALSPSVKAGGYGTAGWAIGGDVIIDMSKLVGVDMEPPNPEGGYTSLRDMAAPGSKGKGKAGLSATNASASGKRRREEDNELRSYDSASGAVASFLLAPGIPSESPDIPSPSNRRRLDPGSSAVNAIRSGSFSRDNTLLLASSSASLSRTADINEKTSTATTTSIVPSAQSVDKSTTASTSSSSAGDPFGYMQLGSPTLYQSSPSAHSLYRSFGSRTGVPIDLEMSASSGNLSSWARPIHQYAYVTFGAGMRQKEIDMYTADHPLEATSLSGTNSRVPYHVPFSAHPVGTSIMVLGGFGFQSRLRGLSIDNLVEVEMVLADGKIIIVNENEHPDLWWALRGAGPVFGVATRYKAKAFPVPIVFAGNIIYRFHSATAPSLIKHFRDCVKGAPRELYANILLTAGPSGKDSLVVIQMCYLGSKQDGQVYLQAISSWDGERCLLNEVDEKIFLHQQDSVAQVLRGKAGRQWFIRSSLITSLPDEIIHKTVLQFSNRPVGCTWLFELAGGAIADYEDTCLPKAQREASFTVAALHQWEINTHDDRCVNSAEEWISDTLLPVTSGGPFPSFLGRHEPPARTMACFGNNWSRLVDLKKKYDPTGLFRNNFWPLDVHGVVIEPREHEPPSP